MSVVNLWLYKHDCHNKTMKANHCSKKKRKGEKGKAKKKKNQKASRRTGLFILSRCAVRELKIIDIFCLRVIYLWISSHELANFACDLIPPCRKSEALWYVVNTGQESHFFRETLFIYVYEKTIWIAWPHASHACESMLCDKTERNINARALANCFSQKR